MVLSPKLIASSSRWPAAWRYWRINPCGKAWR